jgi:2-methylcitrate dehydratase PrpD
VRLEADAAMPRFGSSVTLELRDGRRGEVAILSPLGDPGTPLAWNEVVEKFERLTRSVIRPRRVPAIAGIIEHIERADGRTLAKALCESLAA